MPSVESRETKRGPRFYVRVRDPRNGKWSSRTFPTRPAAAAFARDIEQEGALWALERLDLDLERTAEATLDAWAGRHFDSLTKPTAETVARYRRIYAADWSPTLGKQRLSAITRTDVARALNARVARGGSDKTVWNSWGVLTHMLKMAARDGLIPRSPSIGITPPRRTEHEDVEHRYLTHGEFGAVLAATPAYWQPLVMMLAGTGMRWGELAALAVADVDPTAQTVRINKAEKRDPANPSRRVVGPTKSRKSNRTVTLPAEVLDAVRPLLDRPRTARLFLPPKAGPLRHRTFYRDLWQRQILPGSKIGEPLPRLHDLRHSHVAWLIAAGAPLPVIQQRLGHEHITTTIDTYGHLLPDVQRAAADAASLVFQAAAAQLEVSAE